MCKKRNEGKKNVKKILRNVGVGVLLFCFGFCGGYIFDRFGIIRNQAGTAADVSGYYKAEQRIEDAKGSITDAAGTVRDASEQIRISINEVGGIRSVANEIGSGIDSAFDGSRVIEIGIQRVMGTLYEAERRNKKMETSGDSKLD